MTPPLECLYCHVHYWPAQQWIHDKCATNGATNNVRGSATNNSQEGIGKPTSSSVEAVEKVESTRKESLQRALRDDEAKPVDFPSSKAGKAISGDVEDGGLERCLDRSRGSKTLNRRSREAYNAYQREYMRKRRESNTGK